MKDGYKYVKAKSKKVKRAIPAWASVAAGKKLPVANFAGTQHKVDNILIEAIAVCRNPVDASTGGDSCFDVLTFFLSPSSWFIVLLFFAVF